MSMAAGVVAEKESEYMFAPTGLGDSELDGRLQGETWVGVISW